MVVNITVFKICSPHCNVAALRGTDNGSCHFHCTALAALCGVCLCLFMFVSCIRRCLFTDLCQTRVGRRYDKTNVKW